TARRKGIDNRNWPNGIGLRPSVPREGRQRGSASCQMQKSTTGKFHAPLPNTGPRRSFRLNVRRFYDRPPFFGLCVVKGVEPFWGLLLARSNIEAEIGKALAYRRIGEGLHHGAVELTDNVFRRGLGSEEAEPPRHVEAGYAALVRGRNVSHARGALRGEIGDRLDCSGAHLGQRGRALHHQ